MPATPTSHFRPEWEHGNRQEHFDKHGKQVAERLGQPAASFGKWHYDEKSKRTVKKARMYFQAEHWNGRGEYDEFRGHFLDCHALFAVTDSSVSSFVTYFPERFDKTVSSEQLRHMTEGDKLLKFRKFLRDKENGGIYQKVRRVHGFK